MKKFLFGFSLLVVLVIVVSIFATAAPINPDFDKKIEEKVKQISNSEIIGGEVSEYVKDFASKRGIESDKINNISKVDFNELPKEVNIENVNDANLAIYAVNYTEKEESKQLFVITYSVEELKGQGDLIVAQDKRMFLHFGSEGEMNSGFLKTATGVKGSLEAGYVVLRDGSITGISTNLEVVNSSASDIEIIIYKNGEPIRFGNVIPAGKKGISKDHDIQSNGVVKVSPGDVISAYARSSGDSSWKNVITMVEITTNN